MKMLMAANWKMFKTMEQAEATAKDFVQVIGEMPDDRELLVFPNFIGIKPVVQVFDTMKDYFVGGQNFYPAEEGAFTGEISPMMLKELGCTYALTGHSERRHVLGEDDAFVGKKTAYALEQGMNVVLCIGETIEQREAGEVEKILEMQLKKGLAGVPKNIAAERLAIAYEPVWAIGTGKVALPEDILGAHAFVRKMLKEMLDNGAEIRILYGGSVKPSNAKEIISLDNVDGVLVGGASLQGESFNGIAKA